MTVTIKDAAKRTGRAHTCLFGFFKKVSHWYEVRDGLRVLCCDWDELSKIMPPKRSYRKTGAFRAMPQSRVEIVAAPATRKHRWRVVKASPAEACRYYREEWNKVIVGVCP